MKQIHGYSRKRAILDGVLVDVTLYAKSAGFRHPVAVTEAVYRTCVEWSEADTQRKGGKWQSSEIRLFDLLVAARTAARAAGSQDRVKFCRFHVPVDGPSTRLIRTDLWMVCGPGDTAAPVITIMLPHED